MRSSNGPVLRFVILFAAIYALLYWLLNGSGPLAFFNEAIHRFTIFQTILASLLLGVVGETVVRAGDVLQGTAFVCSVGEGCNGMIAIVLGAAGVLSFPVAWKAKWIGLGLIIPGIVAINVVRISGLFWTGVHHPAVFDLAHVYVGQVFVIVLTATLWWVWLNWSSRPHAASS